jgi:hypothetical protein
MIKRQPGLAFEEIVSGYVVLSIALPLRVRGVRALGAARRKNYGQTPEQEQRGYTTALHKSHTLL